MIKRKCQSSVNTNDTKLSFICKLDWKWICFSNKKSHSGMPFCWFMVLYIYIL